MCVAVTWFALCCSYLQQEISPSEQGLQQACITCVAEYEPRVRIVIEGFPSWSLLRVRL